MEKKSGRKYAVIRRPILSDTPAEFAAHGVIKISSPVKIFYDFIDNGIGSITFPIENAKEIHTLIENATPSHFGKGQ